MLRKLIARVYGDDHRDRAGLTGTGCLEEELQRDKIDTAAVARLLIAGNVHDKLRPMAWKVVLGVYPLAKEGRARKLRAQRRQYRQEFMTRVFGTSATDPDKADSGLRRPDSEAGAAAGHVEVRAAGTAVDRDEALPPVSAQDHPIAVASGAGAGVGAGAGSAPRAGIARDSGCTGESCATGTGDDEVPPEASEAGRQGADDGCIAGVGAGGSLTKCETSLAQFTRELLDNDETQVRVGPSLRCILMDVHRTPRYLPAPRHDALARVLLWFTGRIAPGTYMGGHNILVAPLCRVIMEDPDPSMSEDDKEADTACCVAALVARWEDMLAPRSMSDHTSAVHEDQVAFTLRAQSNEPRVWRMLQAMSPGLALAVMHSRHRTLYAHDSGRWSLVEALWDVFVSTRDLSATVHAVGLALIRTRIGRTGLADRAGIDTDTDTMVRMLMERVHTHELEPLLRAATACASKSLPPSR